MVQTCFRHQHPDFYDRPFIDAPPNISGQWEEMPCQGTVVAEEPTGNPDVHYLGTLRGD